MTVENSNTLPKHFIQNIIEGDLAQGKISKLITRFPPEPNGFLHIGHAKSICLNFGIAEQYNGFCHLRFDDTNPEKESQEYIEAIMEDVRWLGYRWEGEVRFASNYFDKIYQFAVELIQSGKAYICSLTADQAREMRGTLTEPGKNSPYRSRSIEENLALFEEMKMGACSEGQHVLRAKIDMSSPNINMRDPILYRIRHAEHHQSGKEWCIYPMYDFTHPVSDALEGITHSLCTLEFEAHRPLYDWVLNNIEGICHPRQIEFSRLNINFTITSKRKLKRLIDENHVTGWDDPRMPTLAGLRRRGFTPQSIRRFCASIGVTKVEGVVDMAMLEHTVRDDLNERSPRAMCVLRPLLVEISNYPDAVEQVLTTLVHPQNEAMGTRQLIMTRNLYIDEEDFSETPPGKWKRLSPGRSVRLRGGYVITCKEVIKDASGKVIKLLCEYDQKTLGKKPEGYKARGVIHWVSASASYEAEIRLYDRLFKEEEPEKSANLGDFVDSLNPVSCQIIRGCRVEASLASPQSKIAYQFEREGYFIFDAIASSDRLVFNRTVELRDSWKGKKAG